MQCRPRDPLRNLAGNQKVTMTSISKKCVVSSITGQQHLYGTRRADSTGYAKHSKSRSTSERLGVCRYKLSDIGVVIVRHFYDVMFESEFSRCLSRPGGFIP